MGWHPRTTRRLEGPVLSRGGIDLDGLEFLLHFRRTSGDPVAQSLQFPSAHAFNSRHADRLIRRTLARHDPLNQRALIGPARNKGLTLEHRRLGAKIQASFLCALPVTHHAPAQ